MKSFRFILLAVLLAVSFAVPASESDGGAMASVTGHVTYRERIALRPGSVVTVKLVDVSRADVKATILAEQRIENPATVPVPFQLDYDPDVIDGHMSYAVQAQIHDVAGQLQWTTTEHIGVLSRGNASSDIEVWVHRVGSRKDGSQASEMQTTAVGKTLVFDCQGFELVVRTGPGEVALYLSGRYAVLPQVRAASGVKYKGEGLLLWMKGDEALFEMDGVRYTGCQRTPMPEVTNYIYTALQPVS